MSDPLLQPASAVAVAPPPKRSKIRVLVVDDSVVARRVLMRALEEDDEIEVVGYAASGEVALQKVAALAPDLLTLDINMPGLSGHDLLPILAERHPRLRVLIISSDVPAEVSNPDHPLSAASGFMAKPSGDVSLGDSIATLQRELPARIKRLVCGPRQPDIKLPFAISPPPAIVTPVHKSNLGGVLAVGVSTGGPTALAKFIAGLPLNFPLPIVIVQHMPPVFTKLLAERISKLTGFNIVEAADDMVLEPGKALLAPGDFHMQLFRQGSQVRVRLDQGPYECSCRPSIDVLLRSVNRTYGSSTIVTILTGMGQDGLRGTEELKRSGAFVIAQDEASSVVWGMPGAVVNAGLANAVLDLGEIADAVCTEARRYV